MFYQLDMITIGLVQFDKIANGLKIEFISQQLRQNKSTQYFN